jgi:3-dehydroquinate dehydratase/shikimate dehydrogenase
MICVTIAQTSRRAALADMGNAAEQCDLIEMRLDRFREVPDIREILAQKSKPIILSCRRVADGGSWDGSEDERLTVLRQCVASRPAYVEIEVDVADAIRPFPPAQRVISYTNLHETPENILDIYRQAQGKNADVVKLMTRIRTPEEAWPLVQILANPPVPTVVVGVGHPGVMLTVLGKKIGAPWVYAALERGLETYPGQPTVFDLDFAYLYNSIGKGTRLVGVSGFGQREYVTTATLNNLFRQTNLPVRCLPLPVGESRLFRKIIDAVKLVGVLVDPDNMSNLLEVPDETETAVRLAGALDLLLRKGDTWHGYSTFIRATLGELERLLQVRFPTEAPLADRYVAIVGVTNLSRIMARGIKQRGGRPVIVSHNKAPAQELARELECRYLHFEALYSTSHDVLVVCDNEVEYMGNLSASSVHPGYLKAGMTVMDLTATLMLTPVLREARARRCGSALPRKLLLDQLAMQARLLTGKEMTRESIEQLMPAFLQIDEETEAF